MIDGNEKEHRQDRESAFALLRIVTRNPADIVSHPEPEFNHRALL